MNIRTKALKNKPDMEAMMSGALTGLWTPEEIRLARLGRIGDDVILWRRAMERACAADVPHHRRYVDARTGRVLTELPACAHPIPVR